jgi:hypothetical protein
MEDLKLKPYDRLKSILNEGELTEKGSDNLDEILGLKQEKKATFWNKIVYLFNKIDSWIFRKPSKMWNTTYYKRK